jgi:hypothetical protein
MKRLQHPQHGFAFAHNANEEATMRSNGWTDEAQPAPAAAPQDNEQQATHEAQAPEGVAPVKRGRKSKADE